MKKQILTAAFCACLALAACSGSSKQGTTDSSAVSQDSSGGNAIADTAGSTAPAGAVSSTGAAGAGDTSGASKDTASKTATPQR